jgi:hypothetical protein
MEKVNAEKLLFSDVAYNKGKSRYVQRTLSSFSLYSKKILSSNLEKEFKEKFLILTLKDFENGVKASKLVENELTLMLNSLYARYRKFKDSI